jgi:hypothetical protein
MYKNDAKVNKLNPIISSFLGRSFSNKTEKRITKGMANWATNGVKRALNL